MAAGNQILPLVVGLWMLSAAFAMTYQQEAARSLVLNDPTQLRRDQMGALATRLLLAVQCPSRVEGNLEQCQQVRWWDLVGGAGGRSWGCPVGLLNYLSVVEYLKRDALQRRGLRCEWKAEFSQSDPWFVGREGHQEVTRPTSSCTFHHHPVKFSFFLWNS